MYFSMDRMMSVNGLANQVGLCYMQVCFAKGKEHVADCEERSQPLALCDAWPREGKKGLHSLLCYHRE